jgi:tetratricopeptide (TPR) repeat protein
MEEVGRGGMGVVYRARQVTLNRDVALKMILAGRLASEAEVKRFFHEARAAAKLQHPNIVAVHEVGLQDGQHYYSMDFIEGSNLEQLVRQHPLPAQQAAEYVRTVADAIHFAHEHGTIHRDLKPTNILIDIFNQPRITDFGLARCEQLDPHLTTSGQILGTPAYISPEQAQAQTEAVGPQSDVYSTGAVLYHLLTQRPPFAAESLPALLDLVVHHEPVSPRALNPTVPRDLETICLKCLQKDPARRYRSARDLADELGRFGRGESILARPPNVAERAWRWCARNRALSASLGTAAFLLVAGVVVSTWQAVRAKAEAAKSQQVARFLQDMLKGVGPSVALGRDTKMLREILDQTAERVGRELNNQPEVRADLQAIIGNVYRDLGLYDKAEAMHREVLATVTHLRGSAHPDVASALCNLGEVLQNQGKLPEAENVDRQALTMRKKLLGTEHPDVAISLENLAQVLGLQGKLKEAEATLREVVAMQKKLLGNENLDLATSIQNLAQTLRVEGNLAQAEIMEREALAMRRKLLGDNHPNVAVSLNGLAVVLVQQGRLHEAEILHREALALRKKLLGSQHPAVSESLNNLAILLHNQGNFAEAETMHREALMIERKILGDEHPSVANSLNNLAVVLRDEGKLAEAETMERQALGLWRNLFGLEHFQVATALNNLAAVLREEDKLGEAETAQREALAMYRKSLGDKHPSAAKGLHNLAVILQRQRKLDAAEAMLRDALAKRRELLGNEHPDVAASLEQLAEVLREEAKLDEVEPLLRECLSIREKKLPDGWPTFSARSAMGENLMARKQYAEAEPLLISGYNGLSEPEARIPAANKPRLQKAAERLIRFYEETAQPDKAAEWKQKLAELTKPAPEAKLGVETKEK